METIDQEQPFNRGRSVDQLINTLDLLSCGILDFTLTAFSDHEKTEHDPWDYLIQAREKLDHARSLLIKNEPWSPRSEQMALTIDSVAAQANWLALNTAIQLAHNDCRDLMQTPLLEEMSILAEHADAVAIEMVDFYQEQHFGAIHSPRMKTPLTSQLTPTLG